MRDDGFFGHDHGVFTRTKHRIDAGKHARAQLLLAVVDATAHPHRTAIGLNQGVHRLHDGGEWPAGQSVHGQLRSLSRPDLGLETLGQTEIQQHRIDVFDVDHVRAIFEVIADVDLAQTGDAIKRRQHFQALQSGVGQGELGLGNFQCSRAFIHRALADEILRHQFLVAFVVRLGDRQFGFGLGELGRLQLVFKLDHHLALAHALAVVEKDLFDPAAHFGPHHHPLA